MIERNVVVDEEHRGQVERGPGGWLCGYAFIDQKRFRQMRKKGNTIVCHGGITFTGKVWDEEGKEHFAVGFDCAHSGDFYVVGREICWRWTVDMAAEEVKSILLQFLQIEQKERKE